MLLCDVGNYSAKFYENGRVFSMEIDELKRYIPKCSIYYINVNKSFNPKNGKFINIEEYFSFKTSYNGLGVDRIAGCYCIDNGVVVDAGSAITVDLMQNGVHQGGFIMPGVSRLLKNFESISPVLKTYFNSQVDLQNLPKKTSDAINYGIVLPIVLSIKNISKNENIYFTGGDGSFFSNFFKNSIYDKNLIFRGMNKALKERGII